MSEWELRVSQREIHRMHVVRLTMEGRETVGRAAKLLGISPRQMKRLRRKMKERGVEGLLHGNRGKTAWNQTASEKIAKVLELARGRYQGLNDTHLSEKLREREDHFIACYGAHDFASGWDRCGQKAWGQASLQATRAKSSGRSAIVVGW